MILFLLLFISFASSTQVIVNSYDSSHVSAKGVFEAGTNINETIVSTVDFEVVLNKVKATGISKSAEPKFVDISPLLVGSKTYKGKSIIYRQKIIAQKPHQ